MSTPSSATAPTKRPPGPHNQNIELVTRENLPQPSEKSSPTSAHPSSASKDPTHQRLVLTDPIALRYLEEDPSVTVVDRNQELHGYEIYIIEQWATSRTHPTFVITTFTGDPQHVAQVGILSVPIDESVWSQRLRVYFKALNQYHARRRETPLGILMITNLSGFPSSLTVIPVPDGDLRKHRFDFFVNENLKRMGCSGRVGLNLAQPNGATIAKFHQLYRTSDKNPIYSSVIELVKLCQAALNLFDKLDIDYADGLLCDVTEKAINDWWLDLGAEFYNIEPHDGILGPTTVSALLGLLMGARNRLNAVNAPVPKDPFDIEGMKRGISHFQKNHRLERTRRLDRHTLDKLHKNSAKAANAEGWYMPRAVKSTVAELSGKGGEMLADVVGRRDKAGIADVETPYIDRFEQLVYGQRCKWLWLGKPLKNASVDIKDGKWDETRGVGKLDRKHTQESVTTHREGSEDVLASLATTSRDADESGREEAHLHRSVTQRATGLFNDGRRGFGRFKDAVRGHHQKDSKDDSYPFSPIDGSRDDLRPRNSMQESRNSPLKSPFKASMADNSLDRALEKQRNTTNLSNRTEAPITNHLLANPTENLSSVFPVEDPEARKAEETAAALEQQQQQESDREASSVDLEKLDSISRTISADPSISIAGSVYSGVDLGDMLPSPEDSAQDIGPLLRRTTSYSDFESRSAKPRPDVFYTRHLSFGLAEDSMISPYFPPPPPPPRTNENLKLQFSYETNISSDLKSLRSAIDILDRKEGTWTRDQLIHIRQLLSQAHDEQEYLENVHDPAASALQDVHDGSAALVRDERESLLEGTKELETLIARLDYEVDGLKGKIEDVEVGVGDFERAVKGVEDRVGELEDEGLKEGRWCLVM